MTIDNYQGTWYFGPIFVMDHYMVKICNVTGFNNNIDERYLRVSTGITVYDDPTTKKLKVIQVDQGWIWLNTLTTS